MPDTERIARGVYLVGGPQISHTEDATSFVIDFGGESVMIDCGTGRSLKTILANTQDPSSYTPTAKKEVLISSIQ